MAAPLRSLSTRGIRNAQVQCMRPCRSRRDSFGFGVLDLLAVLAVAFITAGLLLPHITRTGCKAPANRIQCVSNLKQVALGFRMWSNDHQEQFPFTVSMTNGGSLEFAESADVFRHFLAISNELVSPRILACPLDPAAQRAHSWTNFSNANVSYFVGLNAREELPASILVGDRNVTGGVMHRTIMVFSNSTTADFTTEIHNKQGNFALADGSGSQATPNMLRKALEAGGLPARFAIPRLSIEKLPIHGEPACKLSAYGR